MSNFKAKPPIKLIAPREGQNVTDFALDFKWQAVGGACRYEIQLSKDADFSRPVCRNVPDFGADVGFWFPKETELCSGDWFWRVRAVTEDGTDATPWPKARVLTVNSDHSRRRPVRKISAENPLFLFYTPKKEQFRSLWSILPDDLKPYVSVRVMPSEEAPGDGALPFIGEADFAGMNLTIQAEGPHIVSGGLYRIVNLAELELAFQKYDSIRFVISVEQYLGSRESGSRRVDYFRRLLALCAKYGRKLLHADGNRNDFEWVRTLADADLMEMIRDYSDYYVPVWKMNHSLSAHAAFSPIFGLWLSGICPCFGVQPENWYWNDAGFRRMGESFGYLQGIEFQTPPSFVAQMMLSGVAAGASVFSFEPEFWLIRKEPDGGIAFSEAGLAALELFRMTVKKRLLPTVEEMRPKIRAALQTETGDLGDTYRQGIFRIFYRGAYGARGDHEILPKDSRYAFLPMFPDEYRPKGVAMLRAGSFGSENEVRELLDGMYEKRFDGDAFLSCCGNTVTGMNSWENEAVPQTFRFCPSRLLQKDIPHLKSVGGVLSPHQYFVLHFEETGFTLQWNSADAEGLPLFLRMDAEPGRPACGERKKYRMEWDGHEKTLKLFLLPGSGPVTLEFPFCAFEPVREVPPLPDGRVPDGKAVCLSDLGWRSVQAGAVLPHRDLSAASVRFGPVPLKMCDVVYSKGLGLCTDSEVEFDLNGAYTFFHAFAGVDDDVFMPIVYSRDNIFWDRPTKEVRVVFQIFADGRKIYDSGVVSSGATVSEIRLFVGNVGKLKLCAKSLNEEKIYVDFASAVVFTA
jgi:hypothetical protein